MSNKFIRICATIIAINIGILIAPVEARAHPLPLQQPQQSPRFLAQACGPRYVVRRGDTLSIISRRCGVTVAAIKRANGLRSDLIRIGQVLILPGSVAPRSAPRPVIPYPTPVRQRSETRVAPIATPAPAEKLPAPPTPAIESTVSPW